LPAAENDGQDGQWTRRALEAMDAEFVAQMKRAIASGQESAPTSTFAVC
jgi:hypothetical protein